MKTWTARPLRLVAGALCVGCLGIGTVWAASASGTADASTDDPATEVDETGEDAGPEYTTVQPERQDLTVSREVDGSLAPATTQSVGSPISGTVVWVADAGAVVGAGDVLAVIDDQPVTIIPGDVPMWRSLTVGDEGSDVLQLETALVGLGFDPTGNVTVDEEYTSATASMVADWQASIGADESGTVGRYDLVVLNDAMTISAVNVVPGNTVEEGSDLMSLVSVDQIVTASLPVADAVTLGIGDAVELELPDRSTIDGVVRSLTLGTDTSIRDVEIDVADAEADADSEPGTDQGSVGASFGGVTVGISWEQVVSAGAWTLPADTLRHLDDGTYVIDVLASDGSVSSITVDPGQVVGSVVEIADLPADIDVIRV